MALDLGTLTGFLDLDASAFEGSLSGAADKLKDFGGKGAALAAGAGVAIGGAIAAGVIGAMNVEGANDKLAAQLGLTGPESERIGKVAGALYAGAYGDSLGAVNGAVAEVLTSIQGMNQASSADLQAVTANALDFATAMDVDVAGAARTAGILVKTGLAADAREAFDLLTVAAQEAGPAMVEPVMEAANEYGVNFASMGISGRAAMAILVDASKGGEIALDKAGDAVKEFGIRATDLGDKGAQDALKAMGLEGEEMANKLLAGGDTAAGAFETIVAGLKGIKDPAAQAEAAVALFGTPLEDIGKDQIPVFLDAMAQAGGELENVAGAADRMGATLNDNASTNLESFKRQVSSAFVDFIGGKALPVVNDIATALSSDFGPAVDTAGDVLTGLGDVVQDVSGFLEDHETTTKALAGVIVALMVPTLVGLAVGYATTATAAVVSGVTQSAAWLKVQVQALATGAVLAVSYALTVAGWVASAAAAVAGGIAIAAAWVMALGPVGAIILGVGAVVAIFVTAYKTSETFRTIVNGAMDAVQRSAGNVVGFLVQGFRGLLTVWLTVAGGIVSGAATALGWIPGVGDKLRVAERAFGTMKGKILGELDAIADKAYGVGAESGQGLVNGLNSKQGAVAAAAQRLAAVAGRAMQTGLQVASPSKLTTYFGQMVGEGLAVGMEDKIGRVDASSSALATAALPTMQDAADMRGLRTGGDSFVQDSLGIPAGATDLAMLVEELRVLGDRVERGLQEQTRRGQSFARTEQERVLG